MTPYFLLILLPTIVWMLNKKIRINAGNKLLYESRSVSIDVFMLLFLFLVAFRGLQCGNDTIQYFRLFSEYGAVSFSDLLNGTEIGYKVFNKLAHMLFNNYQSLLIITALICICPLWYFYKKESEHSLLTLALFLTVAPFYMYFSGIRQTIAMALGIVAWYAAKNKKLWLFIAIVVLAIQFHASAFVLLMMYPLYHARITKKWLWFVVPCIVAIYFFRNVIFDFFYMFLWKEYESATETGAVTILILLILFAIYSYVLVDEELLDRETIAIRNMLLLSVVIQIFAMLHPLSMRVNYYFLIFVPVLIPKIAKRCKSSYAEIGRLSIFVMTVFFFGYFIKDVITDNDPLNIYPYIPFWENG